MSVWPLPSTDALVDLPVRHGAPERNPSFSIEADNLVGVAASNAPTGPDVIHPCICLALFCHDCHKSSSNGRSRNERRPQNNMLELNTVADNDRLLIWKVIDIGRMREHEDSALGQLHSR